MKLLHRFSQSHKKVLALLKKSDWINNLIAGVIVGIVALPLSMAFAIASGVKPEQGIYTAMIAGFIVSIFGGCRFQIAGPTGAFIVILYNITSQYGVEGLQVATLMAGLILLVFSLTKMGSVIKFIPDPVIVGFTSGIAIIIWVGQWSYFFGLPNIIAKHFHEKLFYLLQALPQFHSSTTLLAVFSLLIVIYGPKIPGCKRIPGPFLALISATLLQMILQFDGIKTIGSVFGGIPSGLPHYTFPQLHWDKILTLIGPAFTIAMLGAIESLLSAVVADGMTGTRHDPNKELFGQGLANIFAPLFNGFAATGAIARTATNIRNGASNPLSGVIHSITLLIILLFLAPLAGSIPLATLSAILFVVAWNMCEAKHFIKMITRAPKADVAILLVTFTLTIFADLVVAVNIGVILAILHFIRRMSTSVEIKQATQEALNDEFPIRKELLNLPQDLLIYTIEGPFFFGASELFERALLSTHTMPKRLLIRLKWVPFIDITALQTLEEVIINLQKNGVIVMMAGSNKRVDVKLRKAGILSLIGEQNYYKTFNEALSIISSF